MVRRVELRLKKRLEVKVGFGAVEGGEAGGGGLGKGKGKGKGMI